MSRFKKLLDPVPIDDPTETVQIRKRASLRVRGLGWGGLAVWALVLLAGWIGRGIITAGWVDWAQIIAGGLLLFGLFGLLVWNVSRVLSGWPARYVLQGYRIQRNPPRGIPRMPPSEMRRVRLGNQTLQAEVLGALDLANAESVQPVALSGIWRVMETGHILLWARGRPAPYLIPFVRQPEAKAAEIRRRLEHLRARGLLAISEEQVSPQKPYTFWAGVIPQLFRSSLAAVAVLFLALLWLTMYFVRPQNLLVFTVIWLVLTILTALIGLPWFLISFLEWWFCVYVVTNKRIILRRGVLSLVRQVLPLEDVNSVMAVRVGLGRFLNVGHVQITTAGRSSNLVMEDVSDPVSISNRIQELQELVRRQSTVMEWGEITGRLEAVLHLPPSSGPAEQS